MTDDGPISRKELLQLGALRLKEAGAYAAGVAIEGAADRLAPHVQRPPGAIVELAFLLECTRCGDCVRACPVHAILTLDHRAGAAAGTPFLDVNRHKPCVVCEDAPCMPACPTTALQVVPMREAVMGTAVVDRATCIEWKETAACQKCYDACPYRGDAILMDEQGRPFIDPRHCIGCGLCGAACPTRPRSIEVEPAPRF